LALNYHYHRALDFALLDDESETDEERQAVEEGKADICEGRALTTTALKRELGYHIK